MNQPPLKIDLPHLEVSRFELPLESSRFDLVLFLSESENGLAGFWLYNPDLFEAETISRLSFEFDALLRQIAGNPEATLASFQVFAEAARQKEMDKEQQQQAQLERLRGRRRKAVDLNRISGVTTGSLLPTNRYLW